MKSFVRALCCAGCLAGGPAHAAAPLTILYHPRSIVELRGQVEVEEFGYTPANPKTRSNQIANTAIGGIYLDKPIGAFAADALRQELRTSGVSLQPGGRCRLTGMVTAAKIDDLGFDADYSLSVHYALAGSDGHAVYQSDRETLFRAAKAGGGESIAVLFAKNINAMLGDDAFAKAFEAACPKEG